ncbi:hypothetical protein MKW94_024185 [Papaver nudicaule]|uniref:DUF155 domain-containing protein n=1 Tax=Papaver nudicaule TaxID=74823 RepID=A0AA41V4S6_PAPNU|nr:hypothetical protein [Papaver nudicaule]
MSQKISRSINKQLKNTIVSLLSSPSTSPSVKLLFSATNSSIIKRPNFLFNFSKTLTYHSRVINLSFNSNPRSFSSISSPHRDSEVTDSIKKADLSVSIPVRAYFMFNRIDLEGLMAMNQPNLIPRTSENIKYALLKFRDANTQAPPSQELEDKSSGSSHSYMVVFPYGSTVMFNMLDHEIDGCLKIIERHASGLLPEMAKDGVSFQSYHMNYEVRVNSNFPSWMQGGPGYLMLQRLDMDGIRLIGSVLGQTIALDYYVRKVDGVIAAFTQLYHGRKKISNYIMRKNKMHRLVGRANSSLAEVMFNLGLFERSYICSLEDPNYSQMREYLHDQFELNQKFVGLDFYLTLMEAFIRSVVAETEERYMVVVRCLYFVGIVVVLKFSPLGDLLRSLLEAIIIKTRL